MDNELHKVVNHKEWLKDELSEAKNELIIDKLSIVKDSTLVVLGIIGVYISFDGFLHTSSFVTKMYFATLTLLAFLLSKFQIKSLLADFEYMDISENKYLDLIEEIEKIDPEDEEVKKLDKRLHIKK